MGWLLHFVSIILVVHIGVIDAQTTDAPYFRRDYKFLNSTNGYYKYHSSPLTWKQAAKKCESESAILYYPENELEVKEVKTLHKKRNWMWLGATRQNGSFAKTIDDRMIEDLYHKWDNDEPNNYAKMEDCVVLIESDKLNDYQCTALLPFVCKKTLEAVMSGRDIIIEAQDIGGDAEPLLGHRNFYDLHINDPKSWEDAKKECEKYASTLFFPEDQTEVGKVTQLADGVYWKEWVWVGASQANQDVSNPQFRTIDGRLLESNESYSNWYPSEPVIDERNKKCVVLCRDGTFKTLPCDYKSAFICKTSVFITQINPDKDLPSNLVAALSPNVEDLNQSHDVTDLIQSLRSLDSLGVNCTQGTIGCKGTCGIDRKSESHVFFGNVVRDELQRFPVGVKVKTMHAIMKVIQQHWNVAINECTRQ